MRRVSVLAFPVILLAACDSVGSEPTTLRSPTLGPPSFQMSNTGVTIIDFGPPDGSGLAGQGLAVNEAGQVVGTILDFGSAVGAFLWADGVMTRIDNIQPSAINDDGLIAGYCGGHACLRNSGVTTDLGTLGGAPSRANDLNNAGQVVGISKTPEGQWHGFLWADGVMTDLGSIEPQAINERGQIAGFCPAFGFPMRACLWENGVITELGTLGGEWSRADDINKVGQVVGTSLTSTGQTHAFLWANGVMTDLGHLGRDHSEARAINDAGQVVGFGCIDGCEDLSPSTSEALVLHGVLWSHGAMTDLGTLGVSPYRLDWSLPEDINEAGQITGASMASAALDDANSTGHAVLWTPAPGNTAPAVSAGPDQQAELGVPVSLTFTFADGTPEGPWTWYVAWGAQEQRCQPPSSCYSMTTTAGTATTANDPITVTHSYTVEGQHTVYVRVTDANGGVGLNDVIVTVTQSANNTPPIVAAGPDAEGWTGTEVSVNASFRDQVTPNGPWAWEIDWGDRVRSLGTASSLSSVVSASHVYTAAGQFVARLTVTDAAGATGSDDVTFTIRANEAPTVDAGPDQQIELGQLMVLTFTFADTTPRPPADLWSLRISWGYGTSTTGGTTQPGEVFLSQRDRYPAAGRYAVIVTVTDPFGAAGSDTVLVSVGTPRQQVQALIDQVNSLVTSGALAQDAAVGLLAKLRQAVAKLDAGRTHLAINQLEAFINQVERLVRRGVLAPEQGQALIAAARGTIGQLRN